MADVTSDLGWDALRLSAAYGQERVTEVLLEVCPHLIHAVAPSDAMSAFHFAARDGSEQAMMKLFAAKPSLINTEASHVWTPLHYAVFNGREAIVERLLAIDPEVIHTVTHSSRTALHLGSRCDSQVSKQYLERLLNLYPEALRAVDLELEDSFRYRGCVGERTHD